MTLQTLVTLLEERTHVHTELIFILILIAETAPNVNNTMWRQFCTK